MSTDSPRFKRLVIEELFGPGSGTIDIPFRLNERVTVLHGRNGSGKTITLGLLAALREGRYSELLRYPFARFTLELDNGASLTIMPSEERPQRASAARGAAARRSRERPELQFTLRQPGAEDLNGKLFDNEVPDERSAGLLPRIAVENGLHRVARDQWRDPISGELLTDHQVLARYYPTFNRFLHRGRNPEPKGLANFRDTLQPIKLIRTDRLYLREEELEREEEGWGIRRPARARLMVEHLSEKIKALVQQADQRYRLTSTRLDSSLGQRLFQPLERVPPPEDLRERSRALREKEERLRSLGLLREPPGAVDETQLTAEQQRAFSIILDDREEKLRPFDGVVDKSERLLQSLNRKLAPKTVKLNVEEGYQVLAANGRPLSLDCLSSGEQHELVLLHELLFDVEPGSLILIDEPELSLHVTWQQDLLPDLMAIAKLADLDFVLATHSPYIIGDHAELMVRLGEPV